MKHQHDKWLAKNSKPAVADKKLAATFYLSGGLVVVTALKNNNVFNLQLYSNVDVITSLLACYVL